MSRVMVLSDWYYPGFKAGGPIQSCTNLVNHLSDDFEFYVYTGDRDFGDTKPYPDISFDKWLSLSDRKFIFYASAALQRRNFLKTVKDIHPDVIYFNSMFSLNFTLLPLLQIILHRIPAKLVLAPRGMLHEGALKIKPLKKRLFIRLLNLLKVPRRLVFQATDEQERLDILKNFPSAKAVNVVGNIPDTRIPDTLPAEKQVGDLRIVFLSRIQQKKNLLFFLGIVNRFQPGANIVFDIYGSKEDAGYWGKVEEAIAASPHQIRYMGELEHSHVPETLLKYHLFVLTTEGENFGHSIFEAFRAGLPVLISDQTPWRNLQEQKAGWDIPLNDEEGYFLALDEMLSMDQQGFEVYVHGARALAKKYFRENNFKEAYRTLFG